MESHQQLKATPNTCQLGYFNVPRLKSWLGRATCLALLILTGCPPLIGVIRWDAWYSGNPTVMQAFQSSDPLVRSRLPFFSTISPQGVVDTAEDSQATMDQELVAAHNAGVNYFVFNYYDPAVFGTEGTLLDRAYDRYQASAYKTYVNQALLLGLADVGPKDQWDQTINNLIIARFQQPTYQKVLGNRPLLFLFADFEHWVEHWDGTWQTAKAKLDLIRSKSSQAGLGNPYIVIMSWWSTCSSELTQQGHHCADELLSQLGLDAVSSYSNPPSVNSTGHDFNYCANLSRAWRDGMQAIYDASPTKFGIVPIVSSGWDTRIINNCNLSPVDNCASWAPGSGVGDPYGPRPREDDWCERATPEQLADHLSDSIRWLRNHGSQSTLAQADTLLIYAWNEFGEGGFIAPMYWEGSERLNAGRRALDPDRCEVTKPLGCPLHPTTVDALPALIFDTQDGAASDPDPYRCAVRASVWKLFCGFDTSQPVLARAYRGNKLVREEASVGNYCEIVKPAGCPNHPDLTSFQPTAVLDAYQSSDTDPTRCAARASEWAAFCGFGSQSPVLSLSTHDWLPAGGGSSVPNRCQVLKPAGCPNYYDQAVYQPSVIYDEYQNAQNDTNRCIARATDYALYCGFPTAMVQANSFINNVLVRSSN